VITEYALPSGSDPPDIAAGPDGNLWFTEYGTSRIGKITTSGAVTEYTLPSGSSPDDIAVGPEKENALWFTEHGTSKIGKITTSGAVTEYVLPAGSYPYGIAVGPEKENALWFTDVDTAKIGRITPSGVITEYSIPSESSHPREITTGPEKEKALWFTDENTFNDTSEIGKIVPPVGNLRAHDSQTIYYSVAANSKYPECGEHAEWANLPCQTQPEEQPETSGLPNLPVARATYNMWDEPLTTTSTVGSSIRTMTMTYDNAGRPLTSETTSTEGKSLPKVTNKYSETTGQLIEQSTGSGSEAKTIKSTYNTLGQLTSYTDANGGTTTYEYEGEGSYKGEKELDGRLKFVNDGKGTQAYTYEETTGVLSKLVDTQGTNTLTFTASYDTEGNMTSESYPNGMTANFTLSATGETTSLAYEKTTHCTEKCTWFSESLIPSIHDQTLEDVNSLATNNYAYDEAGRLIEARETPMGEYYKTRIYTYDPESDRTSLITREPNSKKECATEGGTEEKHSYDTGDRLIDTGVKYNEFGDITNLPASDADGTELQSTYYVDGQLDEQKQGEQTIGHQLDPAGRPNETIDTGTINSTYQSHYAGPGSSPSWTIEPTSGHWIRYVQGIGGLAAIETSTSEPVLQLTDLHGDIVARASLSETATKLLSTERSTEYGVPTTSKPEKYSWLGGDLEPTELSSGVVAMGARSYVPEIGRFLQPDPVPGGTDNPYAYTNGDPVNETDLTGEFVEGAYLYAFNAEENLRSTEREAAREQAAREEAERKAAEAAAIVAMNARMAAEQAALEAQNRWFAEATEGAAVKEAEASWCGGAYKACSEEGGGVVSPGLLDPLACSDGCGGNTGQHGSPNEGGTGSCRSGGSRNKKGECQPGHEGGGQGGCEWVAGSGGAIAGGAIGTAIGGPGGGLLGGALGGWLGGAVCG
jgi:RHS repeat-associated protein